eukprot:TRINITY_DN6840_c0_g1_i1.p1 TRINITY_DN6840_c0_g1~~TRINITY_DN6840_c0_g1_i1.p1  ORF type:complete len:787 (-),score=125.19 TRINITY_DN6840_c0_g1_i1:63-2423(-)
MSDLKSSVQRFLHTSESCRLCIEVKTLASEHSKGKKKLRYLSIVSEEVKKEYAVLILKKPKKLLGQYQVDCIFPIYKDMKIDVKEDDIISLNIPWRGETRNYHVPSKSSLENLLDEMAYVSYVTVQNDFDSTKNSHIWIAHYMPSPAETGDMGVPQTASIKSPTPSRISGNDDPLLVVPPGLVKGNPSKEDESRDIIKIQMKERQAEYTDNWDFKVMICTWNVNCRIFESGELGPYLKIGSEKSPDIIAVGLQEVDMSAEAMLLNDVSKGKMWESKLTAEVNSGPIKYDMICTKQLAGLFLIVFAKEQISPIISDVQVECVAVGTLGLMGNKGGIGIRLQFHDSTICFINSHLAAHQENFQRRNEDFREIYRQMRFEGGNEAYEAQDHDILFWFGDLNYRINLPYDVVRQKCDEKAWSELLDYDQLIAQRRSGAAFADFEEGRPDFAPTYKYDPYTQIYDTSEKKRIPAYCDRILWKTGSPVTLDHYYRGEIKFSDHRPVFGLFTVQVRVVDPAKKSELFQVLARGVDRAQNELMPDTCVSCNSFHFEDVRYGITYSKSFVLENIGTATARFRFIPKNHEKSVCKPWLSVFPKLGTLPPGAKVVITLTICVDSSTAPMMNRGKDKIEDILILSMIHGRHHFISVTGSYMKSCFGMSLMDLVRMPDAIRSSPLPADKDEDTEETPLLIPKELWRLIDYLYRFGLDEPNLFVIGGTPLEMENIRECLDNNTEFNFNKQVHSVGDVLVRWLDSLPEPIVPFTLYQKCIDTAGNHQLIKQVNARKGIKKS